MQKNTYIWRKEKETNKREREGGRERREGGTSQHLKGEREEREAPANT